MELARVYDILTVKDCYKRDNLMEYLHIVEDKLVKEINKTEREVHTAPVDLFKGHTVYPCSNFALIVNTSNQTVKIQTYDQTDFIRAISYMNYILHPGQTAQVQAIGTDYIYAWFTWQSLMKKPALGKKYIWNGTRLVEG